MLKARETWPAVARVYCHPFEGRWPKEADVLDEVPVASCRRRGAAIDLVLEPPAGPLPVRVHRGQGTPRHLLAAWLADQLSRLEVRYPEVGMVFADSRRFAEDWTHRFLSSALADTESSEQ